MTLIADIRHILDEHGNIPLDSLPRRRRALRLAQLVEAGGPLEVGPFRETLVPCTARPRGTPCLGHDHRILACCPACERHEVVISGWEMTAWADGPMEPAAGADLEVSSEVT